MPSTVRVDDDDVVSLADSRINRHIVEVPVEEPVGTPTRSLCSGTLPRPRRHPPTQPLTAISGQTHSRHYIHFGEEQIYRPEPGPSQPPPMPAQNQTMLPRQAGHVQAGTWPAPTRLNHSQWSHSLSPEMSAGGGTMRFFGGEVATKIGGVETIMKPKDFLKLSGADRRAIATTGWTQHWINNHNGPSPLALPPPSPSRAGSVVSVGSHRPEGSVRSSSSAGGRRCQLCKKTPKVPCINGVRICPDCYQNYHRNNR